MAIICGDAEKVQIHLNPSKIEERPPTPDLCQTLVHLILPVLFCCYLVRGPVSSH